MMLLSVFVPSNITKTSALKLNNSIEQSTSETKLYIYIYIQCVAYTATY